MLIGASETDERSSSRASSRLQTQLARQVTSAAMATAAAKLAASLSCRVAMRCQSFNRQNMRSMKIAAFVGARIEQSSGWKCLRVRLLGITGCVPRSSRNCRSPLLS